MGSRSLLQGIFPAQGLNPGLRYCRRILYQEFFTQGSSLSQQGSPWVGRPGRRGKALSACLRGTRILFIMSETRPVSTEVMGWPKSLFLFSVSSFRKTRMKFLADPGCLLNVAPKTSGSYAGRELLCDRTAENQISAAEHQSQVMTGATTGRGRHRHGQLRARSLPSQAFNPHHGLTSRCTPRYCHTRRQRSGETK